ncbi:DUF2158 domain-containing protein [Luteibacter sp. PPL552]
MAEQFKPGDRVQLKSGGPIMTVNEIYDNGRVGCEWFDSKEQHQERTFTPETLELYNPAAGFI